MSETFLVVIAGGMLLAFNGYRPESLLDQRPAKDPIRYSRAPHNKIIGAKKSIIPRVRNPDLEILVFSAFWEIALHSFFHNFLCSTFSFLLFWKNSYDLIIRPTGMVFYFS